MKNFIFKLFLIVTMLSSVNAYAVDRQINGNSISEFIVQPSSSALYIHIRVVNNIAHCGGRIYLPVTDPFYDSVSKTILAASYSATPNLTFFGDDADMYNGYCRLTHVSINF